MSKKHTVNFLLVAVWVLAIFGVYNSFSAQEEIQEVRRENKIAQEHMIKAYDSIRRLNNSLKWTKEELNKCSGSMSGAGEQTR